MKTTRIKDGYVSNETTTDFDDTPLKDEWQLPVYIFAAGLAQRNDRGTILDIGCGSGYKLVHCFPEANTIGVDSNHETLEFARKTHEKSLRVWMSTGELKEMMSHIDQDDWFKDEVLCICSDVIEHVENPVNFMSWLVSLLWGDLVISTPCRELGEEPDGPPGNPSHYREWTFNEFREFVDQWSDEIEVKAHCIVNPEQRTQMMWITRNNNEESSIKEDQTQG